MSETFKALAVNSRKNAHDYVDKMENELKDGTSKKAEEYMKLAQHQRNEVKVYDGEAEK